MKKTILALSLLLAASGSTLAGDIEQPPAPSGDSTPTASTGAPATPAEDDGVTAAIVQSLVNAGLTILRVG